jgi:hypothetical protein
MHYDFAARPVGFAAAGFALQARVFLRGWFGGENQAGGKWLCPGAFP